MPTDPYQELAEFVARKFDEVKDEMRTIAAVTVESFRSDLKVVSEQVLENGAQIRENRVRIEENGRRIDDLTLRVEATGERVDRLAERFDRFEASA